MKNLVLLFVAALSFNSFAIEFITEAQVAQALGAEKVIEVSKYAVEPLLDRGSECETLSSSKSARAYVVKKGTDAYLYVTSSGLRELTSCTKL